MTSRVFKYRLLLQHRELIWMPESASILSVAIQDGFPVLYAVVAVDDQTKLSPRIIRTVSTGEEFNSNNCFYIGSTMYGAPTWFVAHVFEQVGREPDPVSDRYAEDFAQVGAELRAAA